MKILLATDGSECSDAAAREVARRPWPADTQVRVISVVEPPAPLVAEPYMIDADYFERVERAMQLITERNPTLTPALNRTDFGAWKRLANIAVYRVRPEAVYGRATV